MSDILTKVRKLNWLLQESPTGAFSYNEMCEILSNLMDANVYVCNTKGRVIGVSLKIKQDRSTIIDAETGVEAFPSEYNEGLMDVKETSANMAGDEALKIFKYDYDTSDKLHTVIPIVGGGNRWGTLIMTRYEPKFTDEDLVLGEYGATIVGLRYRESKQLRRKRKPDRLQWFRWQSEPFPTQRLRLCSAFSQSLMEMRDCWLPARLPINRESQDLLL